MEQAEASKRTANELIRKGLLLAFNKKDAIIELERLFAIGYDEGRKLQGPRKRIAKLDHNGEILATYKSASDAARLNKYNGKNLSRAASGKRGTAYGYHWKYL